jgi:hypothetical protein
MTFNIFWKSWNRSSYCRQCLLYWFCWHLVIKRSSLTFNEPKNELWYHLLWMWWPGGIRHLVTWVGLLITRIHMRVALESKTQWLLATLHNKGSMDYCLVHRWSVMPILVLDTVNVDMEYDYSTSCYYCIQRHVPSYRWCYASFSSEEDWMEGRLILHREVCIAEVV